MKECLEGDEQAWSALIDKYKNLIYSIPIKYGLPRDDAGEIFQQVCLRLLSDLSSLRDPQSLGGWLITVTSHKCLDWGRRQRLHDRLTSGTQDTIPVSPSSILTKSCCRQNVNRSCVRPCSGLLGGAGS